MALEFVDDAERSIRGFPIRGGDEVDLRGMTWDELDKWTNDFYKIGENYQATSLKIEAESAARLKQDEGEPGEKTSRDVIREALLGMSRTQIDLELNKAYRDLHRKSSKAALGLVLEMVNTLTGGDYKKEDMPSWAGAYSKSGDREAFAKRALDHAASGPKALSEANDPTAATDMEQMMETLRRSGASTTSSTQSEE